MKKIIILLNLFTLTIVSCSKEDSPEEPVILSDQNLITSFSIQINNETISGNIDEVNKTINFDVVGADLNSLVPIVNYSAKSQIIPSENEPQNFNNEVIYNVIAENGDSNAYRVIINNRPLSSENKILSFSLVINNKTVDTNIDHDAKLITFNAGSFDITALNPAITISEYASISPSSNETQNFDNTIVYTVTAENSVIAEYKVHANHSNITGISTIGGTFTQNPTLLYVGAEIFVVGDFLDPNRPNAKFYLTDGTNNYDLPILKSEKYSVNDYIITYNLYTKIPENVPTYSNYRINYEVNDFISESEGFIDILAENLPKPLSLNQDLYKRNDVLIITGENLTDMIAIPSNGSVFLIENSNNYDYTVNTERSEARLTLDYYYLFRDPEDKIITLLGPGRRAGESIKTIFK